MPEECSADILEMVDSCLQEDPHLRPTAKEVGRAMCIVSRPGLSREVLCARRPHLQPLAPARATPSWLVRYALRCYSQHRTFQASL